MSIESSIEYERIITDETRRRLGGSASPRLIHLAVDFAEIHQLQDAGEWDKAGEVVGDAARRLELAGAELILLCSNTMHKVISFIEAAITVPLIHLADATAAAVKRADVDTVALLGTRYTMEQDFYRSRLEGHGLTVLVPGEPDRTTVHDTIFRELVRGEINPVSRAEFVAISERLFETGAQGLIAGCTEIELLLGPNDIALPFFPTSRIHAVAAVDAALSTSSSD